jgi:hypothetical protein
LCEKFRGATLLFDKYAAASLITGEPFWTVASDEMSVNFTLSAFLRQGDDNEIVPYNTAISAIMLVAITHDASYIYGALHPKADHSFDSRPLLGGSVHTMQGLAHWKNADQTGLDARN